MTSRCMKCVGLVAVIQLVAVVVVCLLQQIAFNDLDQSALELKVLLITAVWKTPEFRLSLEDDKQMLQLLLGDWDKESGVEEVEEKASVVAVVRPKRQLGFDNILTDILRAQEEVIVSHCSDHTASCLQGPKGEKGTPGPKGVQGPKGVPGATGAKGEPGVVGPKGQAGVAGAAGPQGAKGDAGPAGAAGPKGDTGLKGDGGDAGPSGDQGHAGPQGDHGDPGVTGAAGATGAQGAAGARGQKGERGPAGERGPSGAQGPPGDVGAVLAAGCECLKAPKITSLPSNVTAQPGGIVSVTCQAEGNPTPTITWDGGRHSSVLRLDQVVYPTDFHQYTCTATNPFGTDSQGVSLVRA